LAVAVDKKKKYEFNENSQRDIELHRKKVPFRGFRDFLTLKKIKNE